MKIIGQIFEESNYDVFVRLDDNRDLLSARLNKLIASISERYILNPIIVNEKMEIIDGQGRFEARKTLNLPIHYIIAPGARVEDCRRMNKYNTKWSKLDFAKSYAKSGKRAYANLLKSCKETGYPLTRVLRLADHSLNRTHATQMTGFEGGRLIFRDEDVQKVIDIKKGADEILEALLYSGQINDALIISIKICMETSRYSHKRMLENCKKCRSDFVKMAKISDQLVEFERVYNKGFTAKNRLYFSDYMRNRGENTRDYQSLKQQSEYKDKDVSTLRREANE